MSDRVEPRGDSTCSDISCSSTETRSVREPPRLMSRSPFMLILLLVLGAVVVGLLALGAFPPSVTPQPVDRALPNERFSSGR